MTIKAEHFNPSHSAINVRTAMFNSEKLSIEGVEVDDSMLESLTLEDVEDAYLVDLPDAKDLMTEAITTSKVRIKKTMAAFERAINKSMNGTDIQTNGVNVGKPKRAGLFAVMAANIQFSDGQSVSVIFHAPDNDPERINEDDTLIAYRFLLNKRDITNVVSPHNGRDISLAQVSMAISNLVEQNSERFKANQEANAQRQKEIDEKTAEIEAKQEQVADLAQQLDELNAKLDRKRIITGKKQEQIDEYTKELEGLQASYSAIQAELDENTKNGDNESADNAGNANAGDLDANGVKKVGSTVNIGDKVYYGGESDTAYKVVQIPETEDGEFLIEHPSGVMSIQMNGYDDFKRQARYRVEKFETETPLFNDLAADLDVLKVGDFRSILSSLDYVLTDAKGGMTLDEYINQGVRQRLIDRANDVIRATSKRATQDDLNLKEALLRNTKQFIEFRDNQQKEETESGGSVALPEHKKEIFNNTVYSRGGYDDVYEAFATKPWPEFVSDAPDAAETIVNAMMPMLRNRLAEKGVEFEGIWPAYYRGVSIDVNGAYIGNNWDKLELILSKKGSKKTVSITPEKAIDSMVNEVIEAANSIVDELGSLFYYGLRARPFAIGAVPSGHAKTLTEKEAVAMFRSVQRFDGKMVRHGAVAYDRELTEKEIVDFELVDLQAIQTNGDAKAFDSFVDQIENGLFKNGVKDSMQVVDKYMDEIGKAFKSGTPSPERVVEILTKKALNETENQQEAETVTGEVDLAIETLNKLKAGEVTDTTEFDRLLDEAANTLEAADLMEQYDELLNEAADKLTELLEQEG